MASSTPMIPSGLDDLLADDVVFLSPGRAPPQHGKAITKAYLSAAFQVFFNPSFRYVREILGPRARRNAGVRD